MTRGDMLALGLEDNRLVIVMDGDPEAGWLLCDLLGDSPCQRIGPTLWKKDLTIIKAFTG